MTTIMPPEKRQPPQTTSGGDPLRPHTASVGGRAPTASLIRLSALALGSVAIIALLVIIFSASVTVAPNGSGDVPFVSAEDTPFRGRPDDAGGMPVDNRDTTVFAAQQQGAGSLAQTGDETIRPRPEQPILGQNPSEGVSEGAPPHTDDMRVPRRADGSLAMTPEEIQQAHRERRMSGDAAGRAMEELESTARNLPPGAATGETSIYVNGQQAERLPLPGDDLVGTSSAPVAVTPVQEESQEEPSPPVAMAPTATDITEEAGAATAAVPTLLPATEDTNSLSVRETEMGESGLEFKPMPVPQPVPDDEQEVATASKTAPVAAAKPSAPRASPDGTHMVQFGAVRDQAAADKELARIKAKHSRLLSALSGHVVKADLGAKGVYWRIRVGPMSADEAKSLCSSLKGEGQDCIVVSK